jgi:hypothetical protein
MKTTYGVGMQSDQESNQHFDFSKADEFQFQLNEIRYHLKSLRDSLDESIYHLKKFRHHLDCAVLHDTVINSFKRGK